jgi:hypothetical protein
MARGAHDWPTLSNSSPVLWRRRIEILLRIWNELKKEGTSRRFISHHLLVAGLTFDVSQVVQ